MKIIKLLSAACVLFLIIGCSAPQETVNDPTRLTIPEGMPVKVEYQRMWIYSAAGQSDDAEYISRLMTALKDIRVGEETDMAAEDYTDIIICTYADNRTVRYEFEADWIVNDDGSRNEIVSGLSEVRKILDELIE